MRSHPSAGELRSWVYATESVTVTAVTGDLRRVMHVCCKSPVPIFRECVTRMLEDDILVPFRIKGKLTSSSSLPSLQDELRFLLENIDLRGNQ
jgi:hypothetical protein